MASLFLFKPKKKVFFLITAFLMKDSTVALTKSFLSEMSNENIRTFDDSRQLLPGGSSGSGGGSASSGGGSSGSSKKYSGSGGSSSGSGGSSSGSGGRSSESSGGSSGSNASNNSTYTGQGSESSNYNYDQSGRSTFQVAIQHVAVDLKKVSNDPNPFDWSKSQWTTVITVSTMMVVGIALFIKLVYETEDDQNPVNEDKTFEDGMSSCLYPASGDKMLYSINEEPNSYSDSSGEFDNAFDKKRDASFKKQRSAAFDTQRNKSSSMGKEIPIDRINSSFKKSLMYEDDIEMGISDVRCFDMNPSNSHVLEPIEKTATSLESAIDLSEHIAKIFTNPSNHDYENAQRSHKPTWKERLKKVIDFLLCRKYRNSVA
mmetsp:Transcript_22999/g.52670  ORF Transcript_22999/g.52670 Transcript_22999/m.52670 type:complete len:373 (-) Transcript_22999:232-1350(-)